jgi:hypothetical protein
MKKGIRLLFYLFVIQGHALTGLHAQDLTGIWRGHFHSNDGMDRLAGINYDDRYKMEVQIAQTANRFEAITYSYKSTEFYGKAEASGTINTQSKKVLLKEGKLLEVRFANGGVCIMTCFMQYSKLGDDEYLQGTYYSTSIKDSTAGCGKGSIFLHRVAESDFHKEPFLEKREKELLSRKKTEAPVKKAAAPPAVKPEGKPATVTAKAPVKTHPPSGPPKKQPAQNTNSQPVAVQKPNTQAPILSNTRGGSVKIVQPVAPVVIPYVLRTRTNTLLKTITVNHSDVELRIYDDGAIDNDTVSVYYDNKLIISNARLSDQPIIYHIQVEPSDQPHQLVMVAENLGDIPPNTSLLVVNDGDKKYEERIISNEQNNVVISFQYKKIQ